MRGGMQARDPGQGWNDKYSWGQGQGHCWHGPGLSAVPRSCIHTVRMQFLHQDLLPCITQLPPPRLSWDWEKMGLEMENSPAPSQLC